MENENGGIQSVNANQLLIKNIYENITNSEEYLRFALGGGMSILEYVSVPPDQRVMVVNDSMYYNLIKLTSELLTMLPDIAPKIGLDKMRGFEVKLNNIYHFLKIKKDYVKETFSASKNKITSSKLTPFFWDTLNALRFIRTNMIMEIKDLLYIEDNDGF